jgi:uncharacterized protein
MTTTLTHDPVLTRFRKALGDMYGSKIERVVLFGSRARGDAHAESDYDVAVFLRDLTDRFPEMNRLADLSTEILDETGAFIHAMPYPAGSYNDHTPLMLGLRADGIDLGSLKPLRFWTRPASVSRRRTVCRPTGPNPGRQRALGNLPPLYLYVTIGAQING